MQLVSDWRPDLTDGCRQTATGCRSVRTISRGSTLNVDTSCDYVVDIHTAVASAILAILVARATKRCLGHAPVSTTARSVDHVGPRLRRLPVSNGCTSRPRTDR